MPADSFYDAREFNRHLQCDSLQENGHPDPIGCFLRDLGNLAEELNETTLTPEGCDQWLADSDTLMSAAIVINLACRRITERAKATRVNRRLIEISNG